MVFSNATSKALSRIVSKDYSGWVGPAIDGSDVVWKLHNDNLLKQLEPIAFSNNQFSVSVTRSGTSNKATVKGVLAVPTKTALAELPLVFSIISTDSLKGGNDNVTDIEVKKGEFSHSFDNLGNSHFFRLKYRWKGAPNPVR